MGKARKWIVWIDAPLIVRAVKKSCAESTGFWKNFQSVFYITVELAIVFRRELAILRACYSDAIKSIERHHF